MKRDGVLQEFIYEKGHGTPGIYSMESKGANKGNPGIYL